MAVLLTLLTGLALLVLLAVVAVGVHTITLSLKGINRSMAKISWGVRAIESETALIGANVPPLVDTFAGLDAGAAVIAERLASAEQHLAVAARALGAQK